MGRRLALAGIAAALAATGGIGAALAASGGGTASARHTTTTTAATAAVPAAASSAAPGTTAHAAGTLVRTDNVLAGLAKATSLGAPPAGTLLTVDVGLAQPNPAAEQAFVTSEYQPGSPDYHHFLSPAAFAARFGVPAATVAAAKSWITSTGLHLGYVSASGTMVSARGTLSQLGALFHVTFGLYRIGAYTFVANQQAPAVPAALPITTVVGLNTLQRMWTEQDVAAADKSPLATAATRSTAASAVARAGSAVQRAVSGSSTTYTGELVPQDLWSVYDTPAGTHCSSTDPSCDTGQGEVAGMFGTGYANGVLSDLRVFEQRLGLPQVPVRVVDEGSLPACSTTYTKAPGQGCTPNDGDVFEDAEWNLDTQAITGMAPGLSRLDMYFASTPFDSDAAVMFDAWANDSNGPPQMDASFGECEADPTSSAFGQLPVLTVGQGALGNQLQLLVESSLEEAVIEGRTLFASAGDSGGSCPAVILPVLSAGNGVIPQPLPFDANYPCASQWATCVGGTVVSTNGTTDPGHTGAPSTDKTTHVQRTSETAWAFTGGGPADNVPEPSYQRGVSAVDLPCTMPVDATNRPITPGTTCRGTPDVAAMSGAGLVDGLLGGQNSYYVNIDMMPLGEGGTSLSSPLTVGMWSIIQAGTQMAGLGFANFTLYGIGTRHLGKPGDFTDITQNELPVGNFYQQAKSGWDYTSGWGALDVSNIIRDVDGNSALSPVHPAAARYSLGLSSLVCVLGLDSPGGNAYDPTLTVPAPYTDDRQLDITGASFHYAVVNKVPSLVINISGPALSTTGPPDAIDGYTFYADWTYDGTTYFAAAAVDQPQSAPGTPATNALGLPVSAPLGQVTYGDGVVDGPSPTMAHADSGSLSNGTFTIVVALSHVGSPPVGTGGALGGALQYPYVYDTLPDGVLVPFAVDEAVGGQSSPQFALKAGC